MVIEEQDLHEEQELQELKEMSKRLMMLKEEAYKLEKLYNKKQFYFQEKCGTKGHQFVAERDEDYHNTRYYYVCKRCEYFTRCKP